MFDMKNPFLINEEQNVLTLKVVGKLENNSWFAYFGEIQNKILDEKVTKIILDLSECVYIDPNPFLSLTLTLNYIKNATKCIITIKLPENDSDNKQKFLRYCKREGFLSLLSDIDSETDKSKYNFEFNTSVSSTKNYHNVIKATIVDLDAENNEDPTYVSKIVQGLLEKIVSYGFEYNYNEKSHLIMKLRNILIELIDNVKCHAYLINSNKLFAVYIRARYSNQCTINHANNGNVISKGQMNKKLFSPDINYSSCLEVYFQDLGIGLIESSILKSYIRKSSKRPLKEIFKKIFFTPHSLPRKGKTTTSGLGLVKEILKTNNDYLAIFNDYEICSSFMEDPRTESIYLINLNDFKNQGANYNIVKIRGLIYNITIVNQNANNEKYIPVDNSKAINSYKLNLENSKLRVKDSRLFLAELENSFDVLSLESNILFYFIEDKNSKHSIVWKIKKTIKEAKNVSTIILCDVKDEEIIIFENTISKTATRIFGGNNISNIFIVSETLKFKSFKNENEIFEKNDTINFLQFNQTYEFLYKLKIYETSVLLTLINNSHLKDYILLKGTIDWNTDTKLDGYINFDILGSDIKIYKFLKTNLLRAISLFKNNKLQSLDVLTQRIATDFNIENNEIIDETNITFLGSVYVSGSTLQSSINSSSSNLHFFNRSNNSSVPALFFSPEKLLKANTNSDIFYYERDGKTHRVRKKGSKNNPIGSNSYLTEEKTFKILHQYVYLPIVCGHFDYEGKHFLLSVDLITLMSDDISKLKYYIESIVKTSLQHYSTIPNKDKDEFFNIFENACLFIYLSHYFTETIIQKAEIDKEFIPYVLGLTHVGIIRFGEGLEFSEEYSRYIKDCISKFKEKYGDNKEVKAILFDTIINTGRTRKEIKQYLSSLGCDIVVFASIIDSQCSHYNKSKKNICYMDISIPIIGSNSNCAICNTKDKLNFFCGNLIDAELIIKTEQIIKNWDVIDLRFFKNKIETKLFTPIKVKDFLSNDSRYYFNDEIEFTKAIPLYLYLSKRIKSENDFYSFECFYSNLQNKIDIESFVFICAIFLIEYNNSIYTSLIDKIVTHIMKNIDNLKDESIIGLTIISLLSLPDSVLYRILERFFTLNNDFELKGENSELIVLLFSDGLRDNKEFNKIVDCVINKIKSGNIRLDSYRQLHSQLINSNGEGHATPLQRLKSNNNNYSKELADASLELLKKSLQKNHIDFDCLTEKDNDEEEPITFEDLIKKIDELRKILPSNKNNTSDFLMKINDIYDKSLKIHSNLFKARGLKKENIGNNLDVVSSIEKIISKHNVNNKEFEVNFDRSYKRNIDNTKINEIYYIWNNPLNKEIEYMLQNLIKHKEFIDKITIDSKSYSGELKIYFEIKYVTIAICNYSTRKASEFSKEIKDRYSKKIFKELGINFEYIDNCNQNEYYNSKFVNDAIIAIIKISNIES